ncbi:MAG: hypothetical protein ABEJ26_05845 [Halosimplex sp.]
MRQASHLEEWASLLDERVSEEAVDEAGRREEAGRRDGRADRSEPRRGG